MPADTHANRYLAGNFAPVKEEVDAADLPVAGSLPKELNGRLLRIGPNPVLDPDPATYHWFSGDGMLHAIHLREGQAKSYRNRWVRTDGAADALGETPPEGAPETWPMGSAVSNTHVVPHAGRIFALVENALPMEVDRDLNSLGRHDFDGRLRSAMTAHPKIDPATGEMLFFGYNIFGPPYLRFHVADASGALVRTEDIEIPGPAMIHDFAITENHVVFFDLPVVFDMDLVAQGLFPFSWQPDSYGARVGVMPRNGTGADVRWVDVEPCYVFHPLNAYDDGDRIVVDVVRHPTMFATDRHGPSGQNPTLDRWTVDLAAGKVLEERLSDHAQEFPRVDDRRAGRRHRYGYGTYFGTDENGLGLGGLLKHDLVAGTSQVHDFGPGTSSSEGVFVAASDTAGEDEGWVLSVVYDQADNSSRLAVLDATDFAAPPVATVQLPQRVPFGFHGSWVPDA
ncbi:MAG TPA: carotenoid oxygenase family protein [Acidimicrobiales bacterium]|nr:carotenoid oxygenase family protein [Acidimicrobiales bacterium]